MTAKFLTSPRFIWWRPVDPPYWFDRRESPDDKLLFVWNKGSSPAPTPYAPLEDEPDLWQQFLEIGKEMSDDERDQAILKFAHAYGPLGAGTWRTPQEYGPKLAWLTYSVERRGLWVSHAQHIYALFTRWRTIQDRPRGYSLPPGQFRPDEELDALCTEVSWRLTFSIENAEDTPLTADAFHLWLNRTPAGIVLELVPPHLLSCIWLQFARVIEGNKRYADCQQCGKIFEIGSNFSSRCDKKFCTGTCKANAHRLLKEKIRQLHKQGVPLDQIAKQTGKNIDRIKEWTKS